LIEYTDQWDWPKAETEFRLSLAAGSHGSAENLYGWCLITRGRFDESRRHLQIAAELDPLSLGPQLNQVEELVAEKRPKEARMKIEQILRAAPSSPIALLLASSVALWQGDCSAAASFNKRLTDVNPTALLGRLGAMAVDYHCGHPERAAKAFEAFAKQPPPGYVSPFAMAEAYASVSDADRAMPYLEKSAELREPVLMLLQVDHAFDPIRLDQRVAAMERRLGLIE
jgi:tetratricopeptide (TPR) repeat protein